MQHNFVILYYTCIEIFQERVEKLQSAKGSPIGSIKGMDKTEIAFKLADKNKDGYIDKQEFEKMAKTLSKDKVDKVFQKCDSNGDGKIDYAEFKTMMDMNKKKQHPREIND